MFLIRGIRLRTKLTVLRMCDIAFACTNVDPIADLVIIIFKGAAKMVLETGKHPASLKDDVQSPAGSSIYAMHRLESQNFRGILIDAVEAACNRSRVTGEGHTNGPETKF